jgi:hypothetical protein
MAPLKHGSLVTLDPALLVSPPRGLEAGYVPIVARQEASAGPAGKSEIPGRFAGTNQGRSSRRTR